jgi:hypothetical protein
MSEFADRRVARVETLRAAGMSHHALTSRCRPSGPWRRLLPGVVLLDNGVPTRRQWLCAARAYAGDDAVISGVDAAVAHGLPVPGTAEVLVLVPASRRLTPRWPLVFERTTRLPEPCWRGGLPMAPLARAVVDAARREDDHDRLRALLAAPLLAEACTIAELRRELDAGNQRGTAAARALLAAGDDAVLPLDLARARRIVHAAQLPTPRWRVPFRTATGDHLGTADAWWPHLNLIWDLGSGCPPPPNATVLRTHPTHLATSPAQVTASLQAAHKSLTR